MTDFLVKMGSVSMSESHIRDKITATYTLLQSADKIRSHILQLSSFHYKD